MHCHKSYTRDPIAAGAIPSRIYPVYHMQLGLWPSIRPRASVPIVPTKLDVGNV